MAEQGGGYGALVTLTHRALQGETLHQALERLRDAMRRLWTGRPKEEWTANVPDWFYGIETTRGSSGNWWHVHAHVVIRVTGETAAVARYIGERWRAATAAAAVDAGHPGQGWDPVAGGCWEDEAGAQWVPSERPGWKAPTKEDKGDPWGWYRPIDLGDPQAVYQACKYPSPCVDLDPLSFAEFVSVAHGRRWHDGGGSWRGASARADELLEGGAVDEQGEEPSYDIGMNVSRCGPKEAPPLDSIAPGIGFVNERDRKRAEKHANVEEWVRWFVSDKVTDRSLLERAVERSGGHLRYEAADLVLELRTSTAAQLLREWDAATKIRPGPSSPDERGPDPPDSPASREPGGGSPGPFS